ncbi:hypothetical protein N7451_008775 [Penicillium sp. IBT 35674x]|nr:hypothetical protein N7451_008775 [Penicillium sp. IBT 35674x]
MTVDKTRSEDAMTMRTLLQFGHGDHPTVSLSAVLSSSLECLYLSHDWEEDFDIVVANLTNVATQEQRGSRISQKSVSSRLIWREFPGQKAGGSLNFLN